MEACYSCSKKPIKDGIYKAHIEKFIFSKLPKDNKHFHKTGSPSKIISGLKPDTCIFYFATKERLFTSPLKKFEDAYGNLINSGCTKTDSKGNAKIFLKCPQIYISLNGNVYNRHLHFIYWDDKNKLWCKSLFTQPLICHVKNDFVEKYKNKALLIDALPEEIYNKKHIKGAVNLPANKRWTENTLQKLITMKKMPHKNKQIPIIVYCYNKKCNASIKVINKLNKLGYYNIVDFEDGICSWKGITDSVKEKKK
jgi:rhodanese-related sulfurtransferase